MDIRLCTYNCRSVMNSYHDVQSLCKNHDLVLLQEHWLMPTQLDLLNCISSDHLMTAMSAMNISDSVRRGRPYGGTAILYSKNIASNISIIDTHEPRLCAVTLLTNGGPVLIVNVYMPCDVGDDVSYDEYVDVCAKIVSLYADTDCVSLVVSGDFNCRQDSRFYKLFAQFLKDLQLICVDLQRLQDVVTFISDDGLHQSWIDHFVCSKAIDPSVVSVNVLSDPICSDHKPLSAVLRFSVTRQVAIAEHNVSLCDVRNWSNMSPDGLESYRHALDASLCNVSIPTSVLSCTETCDVSSHRHVIDAYYTDIVRCLQAETCAAVPISKPRTCATNYNVPGWSDYVSEKHSIARSAFLEWCYVGKPRSGPTYMHMYKSRVTFKQALRFCKRHEEQMKADACAHALDGTDPREFWRCVARTANNKATKHVNKIDNAVGNDAICNLWHDQFKNLYNTVIDDVSRDEFVRACSTDSSRVSNVTVREVRDAIRLQKKCKAAGPNNLCMESFLHAGVRLCVHLSFLYNMCLKHCYLPDSFMEMLIVPLVKNKCGDLTDSNNYRAIALSNAETKILEKILLNKITEYRDIDKYQFGFKKGHSTSLCAGAVKDVVQYYANQGSHVFMCFVDFTKAFDRVNYWKLFKQLLDDGVDLSIVKLLAYWYSTQQACVLWQNVKSCAFVIRNGTKQGGVLSPYLFSRYIQPLISNISASSIGCFVGREPVNIFAYADDLVLLAPTWAALQDLLNLLCISCDALNIVCNSKKTVCMVVNPRDRSKIISARFPEFVINGACLKFVMEFRYLGHMFCSNFRDDIDIYREIRSLYARTNTMSRRYRLCSFSVKVRLFRTYCTCLYGVALWSHYNNSTITKFKSCYNKCLKFFLGYKKYSSVTSALLCSGLPSCDTVLANYKFSFDQQRSDCANKLIQILRHYVCPF